MWVVDRSKLYTSTALSTSSAQLFLLSTMRKLLKVAKFGASPLLIIFRKSAIVCLGYPGRQPHSAESSQ